MADVITRVYIPSQALTSGPVRRQIQRLIGDAGGATWYQGTGVWGGSSEEVRILEVAHNFADVRVSQDLAALRYAMHVSGERAVMSATWPASVVVSLKGKVDL